MLKLETREDKSRCKEQIFYDQWAHLLRDNMSNGCTTDA